MRTNAGRDHQARVMGNGNHPDAGTGEMRPANYMGVSADPTAPSPTDTTLPGEVTEGQLARDLEVATYTHTDGTASYTLRRTFTSDQDITIRQVGIFNAPSAGTMTFIELLETEVPLEIGDQMALTATITL